MNGLDEAGCSYAYYANKNMEGRDASYKEHKDIVERLREPLGKAFKLTEAQVANMTFPECSRYSDTIFARKFEVLPDIYNFTKE